MILTEKQLREIEQSPVKCKISIKDLISSHRELQILLNTALDLMADGWHIVEDNNDTSEHDERKDSIRIYLESKAREQLQSLQGVGVEAKE